MTARPARRKLAHAQGDELLRASGLRRTQFTLLKVLPSRREVSQGQLTELLAVDSTTLTLTPARLRARNWIEMKRGADRRERWFRLTPLGRRRLNEAEPDRERAQRRLRQALGDSDWKNFDPFWDHARCSAGIKIFVAI